MEEGGVSLSGRERRRRSGSGVPQEIGYHLEPGYIYFDSKESVIRTVVGSCVAVCLWDCRLKFGGMNHFLHPVVRDPREAFPKYGNVATIALVRMMEEAGCRSQDLRAYIFGGGHKAGTGGEKIGAANVRIARKILRRKGIRIVTEDVGGQMGRKVLFDVQTGHVATLKVNALRGSDWIEG